jgi:hypothetical protein
VSGLLTRLVDDAGLFPPEQLPMAAALARHRLDEKSGHLMLTHRFLCPASRIAELRGDPALENWSGAPPERLAERGAERRLRLGLVLDTGLDRLPAVLAEIADEPRLVLQTVEVPAPTAEDVTDALETLVGFDPDAFIEGPRGDPGWVKTLATWRRPGGRRGAKVRCGGARAELFPSPEELAAFLCVCAESGLSYKATAGLHGAVRHRDEQTGFVHHGFLNLVLGTVRAASKATLEEVTDVLTSTDETALAAEARSVSRLADSRPAVSLARYLLVGYGSCSTREPREEAARLGLLGLM